MRTNQPPLPLAPSEREICVTRESLIPAVVKHLDVILLGIIVPLILFLAFRMENITRDDPMFQPRSPAEWSEFFFIFSHPYFWLFTFLWCAVLVCIVFFTTFYSKKRSLQVTLTNQHIIYRENFLPYKLSLSKIKGMELKQTFMGKAFGYGTLLIVLTKEEKLLLILRNIQEVQKFREQLQAARVGCLSC